MITAECFFVTWSEAKQRIGGFIPKTIASFRSDKLVGNDAAGHRPKEPIGQRVLCQHSSEQIQMCGIPVIM